MATVFEGRVLSVQVDNHRFPNGREHRVEIVRHGPSIVLIPMERDGTIVLVKQYRPPIGLETWEVPAGSVKPHESPEDAARRECEEEIHRVPKRLEPIRSLYPAPGFCDEELIFFRATDLELPPADSPHHPDEDEYLEPKRVSVDEARRMVEKGEIVDLKTAYALTLI